MKLLSFFILFISFKLIGFSQVWEQKSFDDYYFSVRDKWGDLGSFIIKYTVKNENASYIAFINGKSDIWVNASFPDDFTLVSADSALTYPQKYNLLAEVDKHIIIDKTFEYYPGYDGLFQLEPIVLLNKYYSYLSGNIIDSYKWDDSLGLNFIIRTENHKTKRIYFYHFIEKHGQIELITKHTDFIKYGTVKHCLEEIEITDINKDKIAEITFIYFLNIPSLEISKMLLITNGKKYLIREKIKKDGYNVDFNLKNEDEFRRYLINKWISLNYD